MAFGFWGLRSPGSDRNHPPPFPGISWSFGYLSVNVAKGIFIILGYGSMALTTFIRLAL